MLVPSKSLASTVVLRHPPSASTDSHAKFLSHWIDPSVPRWLAFISHNLLENVLMISSLFWAEPEVPDLLRRSGCQRLLQFSVIHSVLIEESAEGILLEVDSHAPPTVLCCERFASFHHIQVGFVTHTNVLTEREMAQFLQCCNPHLPSIVIQVGWDVLLLVVIMIEHPIPKRCAAPRDGWQKRTPREQRRQRRCRREVSFWMRCQMWSIRFVGHPRSLHPLMVMVSVPSACTLWTAFRYPISGSH